VVNRAPRPPAGVQLHGLEKRFGAVTVLHPIDLAIEPGELMVLVGPSGCGKTTILRLIAGLEEPSAGEILIGDRVVNALEPADRDVAMVFQNYALYPHKTVRDNLAFGLRMRRRPAAEIASQVEWVAGVLGLETLLDRRPAQLSGGQKQRVAFGRAMVRHPDVFLFDEPLSNLDARLRTEMRREIADLHDRLGSTMIYVTHDLPSTWSPVSSPPIRIPASWPRRPSRPRRGTWGRRCASAWRHQHRAAPSSSACDPNR
jgi:multiple sugar transport system ATP-binding protein